MNSTKRPKLTLAQQAIRYANSPVGLIEARLVRAGMSKPLREHRFHPDRMWRFDLAWPDHRLAVEYDGGTYSARKGGHNSISGMARDREKDAHAAIIGWTVIRLDAKTAERVGIQWVLQWLEARAQEALALRDAKA